MEIPVYVFTGFLEAGKTKFIQETLEDKRFNKGERTLLLVCEEGLEEYDPSTFSGNNVFVHVVEEAEWFTPDRLSALVKRNKAERVVVEYNGMWQLNSFYNALPDDWIVYQEMMFADSTTFVNYNTNIRSPVLHIRWDIRSFRQKKTNLQVFIYKNQLSGIRILHLLAGDPDLFQKLQCFLCKPPFCEGECQITCLFFHSVTLHAPLLDRQQAVHADSGFPAGVRKYPVSAAEIPYSSTTSTQSFAFA